MFLYYILYYITFLFCRYIKFLLLHVLMV